MCEGSCAHTVLTLQRFSGTLDTITALLTQLLSRGFSSTSLKYCFIFTALLTQLLSRAFSSTSLKYTFIFTACYRRAVALLLFFPPDSSAQKISERHNPRGLSMLTVYIILQPQMRCWKHLMSKQTTVTFRCFVRLLTFTRTLHMLQFIWKF